MIVEKRIFAFEHRGDWHKDDPMDGKTTAVK
jgi:hypothetical protein